jgi:putative hemolysin
MSDPESSSGQKKLIDLHKQLKNPALRIFAPVLERTLGISEFNEKYKLVTNHKTERNFFDHALHILGINYVISAEDRDRIPRTGPLIIVANHPHGGSDALALGSLLVSVRNDVKFLANYLTGIVPELDPYFFYVDPFAGNAAVKSNIGPLKLAIKHLKAGGSLATFPSGTVSHLHLLKRRVTDPQWTANSAAIARMTHATIIPVYIDGRNTDWFQLAGLIHPMLRTALLIREMMNQQGRSLELRVGQPIPPSRMEKFKSDEEATEYLRLKTYLLANRDKTERRHRFIKMPRLIWGKNRSQLPPIRTPLKPRSRPCRRTSCSSTTAKCPSTAAITITSLS